MALNAALMRSLNKRFDAIRGLSPEKLVPEDDRWKLSVKDLKVGSFLRFEGKTWVVEQAGLYNEFSDSFKKKKKYNWTEYRLFSIETGEIKNIEWEIDDDIEISVTLKEIKFRDLRDDEGADIDEDDLDEICDKGWEIFYRGKRFNYDDDYAAKYYRDFSEESGENIYVYEFVAHDDEMISIEEWDSGSGNESYEIFLSRAASEDEFEVLSKS